MCVCVCVCVCVYLHASVCCERERIVCMYLHVRAKSPLPESDYLHDVNTTGWMGRGCNDGEEEVCAFVGKRHVPLNGIMMLCARTHSRLHF